MSRQEFKAKTKIEAFARANGRCERCSCLLKVGQFRYNHRIPDYQGGKPTLENCEVLCFSCDCKQTYGTDIPAIAKSRRIRKREAGVRKQRTITGWRKFNGEIVRATKER